MDTSVRSAMIGSYRRTPPKSLLASFRSTSETCEYVIGEYFMWVRDIGLGVVLHIQRSRSLASQLLSHLGIVEHEQLGQLANDIEPTLC